MNFASDNAAAASPRVMAHLARAQEGTAAAYGADPWTARVEARLAALFEREVAVSLLATGTAANALALACLVDPWGAVLTHEESHVAEDECGAPEFFSHGAKLVGLPGTGAKLAPATVLAQLARMPTGLVKQVQPQALSITQATECGLVYRPDEVAALTAAARTRGLAVHMDGARFANAVAALGCRPAEITWEAGVDVLTFGATKNGAWAAEAVVFFDRDRAAELPWRRKRGGHTLSKGRFLGAQFEALLEEDHWLELARTANARAARLGEGFARLADVRLGWPVEANEVFAILPDARAARWRAAGAQFHPWSPRALPPGLAPGPGETLVRFVCSFATTEAEIAALLAS
jgi:threonine aldolase